MARLPRLALLAVLTATFTTACSTAGPVDPWSRVPLAEGATAASTPPTVFHNAAGDVACPVMGMAMPTPDAAVSYADHAGMRYFFCCDSCEKLFLEDPEAYANGKYLDSHKLDPTAPSCSEPG